MRKRARVKDLTFNTPGRRREQYGWELTRGGCDLTAYISFVPSGFQIRLNTEFFGVESEFFRFFAAGVAHNDVEQDQSGFLTFDPIRRPFEWRGAMFTNPTHIYLAL